STFHGQPLGIDPSNNSYDTQLDVSIPDGLQGDFYIVVFTDAVDLLFANEITNTVKEFAGEGRHIMAVPLHIDLNPLPPPQVRNIVVPEHITPGQPFDVTYTVTNNGSGATSAFIWLDSLYLSPDPVLDFNHAIALSPPTGSPYPFSPIFGGLAPG